MMDGHQLDGGDQWFDWRGQEEGRFPSSCHRCNSTAFDLLFGVGKWERRINTRNWEEEEEEEEEPHLTNNSPPPSLPLSLFHHH